MIVAGVLVGLVLVLVLGLRARRRRGEFVPAAVVLTSADVSGRSSRRKLKGGKL